MLRIALTKFGMIIGEFDESENRILVRNPKVINIIDQKGTQIQFIVAPLIGSPTELVMSTDDVMTYDVRDTTVIDAYNHAVSGLVKAYPKDIIELNKHRN